MNTRLRDVRVLVADDDALIRSALSELIEGRPGLALVGTAVDAESAIALAISSRPDVAHARLPDSGRRRPRGAGDHPAVPGNRSALPFRLRRSWHCQQDA